MTHYTQAFLAVQMCAVTTGGGGRREEEEVSGGTNPDPTSQGLPLSGETVCKKLFSQGLVNT